MSFTRVEQDGIEFYTLKSNGASGMSIAALARLCDVSDTTISRLLDSIARHSVRSKRLKRFSGQDLYLGIKAQKGARIIRAEVCSAIIRYYGFESDRQSEVAQYSYDKFADMGMEDWIQGITGWKPAPELTEDAVIDFITDRLESGMIAAGIQTDAVIDMLKRCEFTGAGFRLYFYLEMMHLQGENPGEPQICTDLNISYATLRKWLPKVHAWSHCADWLQLQGRKGPEYPIQKRMCDELGGKMEAFTPAGRIDLVTDTEIIEIKRIKLWKDAFGEVVVKGYYFPKHQKRIHLFGEAKKLKPIILTTCEAMDILVTFEPAIVEAETTDDPWAAVV